MYVQVETNTRRGKLTVPVKPVSKIENDIFHVMAADAVIAEVAGQDEAWQDHIRERDLPEDDTDGTFTEDTTPWVSDSGILDGALAPVAA